MRPPRALDLGPNELAIVVAVALAVAAAVVVALLVGRALVRAFVARARLARAIQGEARAAGLLEARGYRIVRAQAPGSYELTVDGEPRAFELRADYLVARRGRRFVAEVKTGRLAPRLATSATRRQLLEYRIAFDADGVLLVDVEAGAVHEVEFPLPSSRARAPRRLVVAVVALSFALAAALVSLVARAV